MRPPHRSAEASRYVAAQASRYVAARASRDFAAAASRAITFVALLALLAAAVPARAPLAAAPNDLDAFMRQVLAKRDDNWKKLQQYILDEREKIEIRGPGHLPLWGDQREYTWYVRDGYFVRSPLKFNGVTIGEDDRRKYETEFLQRVKDREKRQAGSTSTSFSVPGGLNEGTKSTDKAADKAAAKTPGSAVAPGDDDLPAGVDGLIRQTRQPQFISSAYFLRFRFEEGKYALVGREQLDGRDVMRIEYYPTKLYSHDQSRRQARSHDPEDPEDIQIQRMLNKVALITLWVEPKSHQIVKYTFSNVGFDFLPAQWLVRLNDLSATMTMGQPFPDVWLPHGLEMTAAMTLAVGGFDLRYTLDYHDYRQPDVKAKVRIKGGN